MQVESVLSALSLSLARSDVHAQTHAHTHTYTHTHIHTQLHRPVADAPLGMDAYVSSLKTRSGNLVACGCQCAAMVAGHERNRWLHVAVCVAVADGTTAFATAGTTSKTPLTHL